MADSKSLEKRRARTLARESFIEAELEKDPAASINAARSFAKNAQLVVGAIKTLQAIVPEWSRTERRALAKAIRIGGNGYTKNTGQHDRG